MQGYIESVSIPAQIAEISALTCEDRQEKCHFIAEERNFINYASGKSGRMDEIEYKEMQYNNLAAGIREHFDMSFVYNVLERIMKSKISFWKNLRFFIFY